MMFGKSFNRKDALQMAAEHESFTPEQLGEWTEMYHGKGKLTDDEVGELSAKIPKAKEISDKIKADKAAEAVCKTCGKAFVKTKWNQVNCAECIAKAKE